MLYTTRAIALHYHKYNDKSLILKAYTEHNGLKTFFVRLGSKISLSYFQPLTLINIVAYRKENNNMQNLKEVSLDEPWHNLSANIVKSAIAVFMAEVFIRSVKQEEQDDDLFTYLEDTTRLLNNDTGNLALYPQTYMLGLSKYLGFFPTPQNNAGERYFDLLSGHFAGTTPPHPHYTDGDETTTMASFIDSYINNTPPLLPNKTQRDYLLLRLTEYFRVHIDTFGTLKSNHVLKEVLA